MYFELEIVDDGLLLRVPCMNPDQYQRPPRHKAVMRLSHLHGRARCRGTATRCRRIPATRGGRRQPCRRRLGDAGIVEVGEPVLPLHLMVIRSLHELLLGLLDLLQNYFQIRIYDATGTLQGGVIAVVGIGGQDQNDFLIPIVKEMVEGRRRKKQRRETQADVEQRKDCIDKSSFLLFPLLLQEEYLNGPWPENIFLGFTPILGLDFIASLAVSLVLLSFCE